MHRLIGFDDCTTNKAVNADGSPIAVGFLSTSEEPSPGLAACLINQDPWHCSIISSIHISLHAISVFKPVWQLQSLSDRSVC